jgi:hypothetical protein
MSLRERLEAKRDIDPITGCWLWTGGKIHGHGFLSYQNRNVYVHRAAMHVYKDFYIFSVELVCHIRECPNKHCFNPDHLYMGDHSSNLNDSYATGRPKPKYWGNKMR